MPSGGPAATSIRSVVYLTQNSIVSASSALAAPATINIEAQITDAGGGLAQLPESVLQAAALLRASCAARLADGRASTLVVSGRPGVPPAPDGLLWSPLAAISGEGSASHENSRGDSWPRLTWSPRILCAR